MTSFDFPRYLTKKSEIYLYSYVVSTCMESTYFNHHKPLNYYRIYNYFGKMPVYIVRQNWKKYVDWGTAEIILQKDVDELKDWMEVRKFEVRCFQHQHYFCIMTGGDFD